MKLIYIYYISILFLLFDSCQNAANKSDDRWIKKHLSHFCFDIPADYSLKFYTKDSINGVLLNSCLTIKITKSYTSPSMFDSQATIVRSTVIGSLKKKVFKYLLGMNKGLTIICAWDTLQSVDLFHGPKKYNAVVFTIKNANVKQNAVFLKIFDSISKNK